MEKKEQLITRDQGNSSVSLPNRVYSVQVFKFSTLRAFPLSAIEIKEWAITLQNANVDPEALQFVILKMQTMELDYNPQEGIRNIFRNLKMVHKTEKGYEILKAIW